MRLTGRAVTTDRLSLRSNLRRKSLCLIAGVPLAWALLAPASGSAATLHVCPHGCAYRQVADAVTAAHAGDSVSVADGTYRGGFAITKNLALNGAGAGQTRITGGGPVITVGTLDAASEPTVTIRDVTITGGVTHSAFGSTVEALGGGLFIPPAATGATPTTLTIIGSAITGNVAAPSSGADAGFPCGPSGDCVFAHAGGGGIDSWGDLTVRSTLVAGNQASGPFTSDADGGGIYSQQGTLTVDHTVVTGNRALAGIPDGRFAEGAGIMVDNFFSPEGTCASPQPSCQFVLRDSVVDGNASRLTSSLPLVSTDGDFVMLANAGGIHVGDNIPTTVERSTIDDNAATSNDPQGEASTIDAGMIVGISPLTMRDSQVDRNLAATTTLTEGDVGPVGSALEADGPATIVDTSIDENVSSTVAPGGAAITSGALFVADDDPLTVKNSTVSKNLTLARSDTGSATVLGGGVFSNTSLLLDHVIVSGNTARAEGPAGDAQGGGIWNGALFAGPPTLTLQNSTVVGNALEASPGIHRQGGGLFTTFPVVRINTLIAGNRPDQCVDCTLAAAMARATATSAAARGSERAASGRRVRRAKPAGLSR
jgi:fibronectin-binding autotransporter adhesin